MRVWHPTFKQYCGFVAVAILFALLGVFCLSVILSFEDLNLHDFVGGAPLWTGLILLFGFPVYGPIAIVAFFPGYFLFEGIINFCAQNRISEPIHAVLASIGVGLMSWFGVVVPALLFGEIGDIQDWLWLNWIGVPAAALSGYLIFWRNWNFDEYE